MRATVALITLFAMGISACGSSRIDPTQMTAATPLASFPTQAPAASERAYSIGVGDKLDVSVFQVEDLSFEELVVDTSGNIHMPLIGAVRSAGLTPSDLSLEIGRRLGERYLRDPQVTVTVKQAANQKVTVDGAVTKPGVYEMRGAVSLLQAVAMAEGPSRTADLSSVAVFRVIDGQRSVALFDLGSIRQGQAADPMVMGDDIIVVDSSRLNAAMREVISVLPALAIFRPY